MSRGGVPADPLVAAGYLKGKMMLQEMSLKERKDAREDKYLGLATRVADAKIKNDGEYLKIAQADLGIRKTESAFNMLIRTDDQMMKREEFSWKREERAKKLAIESGLSEAVRGGGYTKGIDFLKAVAPALAIEFHASKLKLDDMIMKNNVMRAQAPLDVNRAMFESYGLLAKMGEGILRAPPKEQQSMYKQIFPMIQRVVPDAPSKYNKEAQSMFLLARTQGMPENILFESRKQSALAETKIGKTYLALEELEQANQVDSPAYQDLQTQLRALRSADQKSTLIASKARINLVQKDVQKEKVKLQANMSLQKDIRTASKYNLERIDALSKIMPLMKVVDDNGANDPRSAYALGEIRNYLVKMSQGSRPTDLDYERAQAAGGFTSLSKRAKEWTRGRKVALLPFEVEQVKHIMNAWMENTYSDQKLIENQYKDFSGNYTFEDANGQSQPLIDWDNMILPSQRLENLMNSESSGEESDQPQQKVLRYNPNTGTLE